MTVEIKVPPLGESVSEVKVARIIASTGSFVPVDGEIVELETDKLNQVIYASTSGVITITVSVGDTLKIGDVIARIEPQQTQAAQKELKRPEPVVASIPKAAAPKTSDLKSIEKKSAVKIQKSTQEWLEEPLSVEKRNARAKEVRKPMSTMRKIIAERLLEAKQTTAMLTTFNEVDMTAIMHMRETFKESFLKKYGVKLGFMSFFVKAAVSGLRSFPIVNSYIDETDLVYRGSIDISIAVATEKGLLVPVLKDCEDLQFFEIEKKIEAFAAQAKAGTVAIDDLHGGGFTITNGGVFGSLLSTPIVNPPQCAILGMHKIQKRPVVVNDEIVVRPMMYLALSYDHRVLDGKEAVSFLVHIKDCLEAPERLLIGM